MSAIDLHPFPRWPLIAAGCLVAISIVGAGAARLMRFDAPTPAQALTERLPTALTHRTLRFSLMADDSLAITDAATGADVLRLAQSESGFIHGAMRGLRRTRMVHGVSRDPVLTIARWSDGRLTASDPQTNTLIDLGAFGADNRKAFEALLAPDPSRPQRGAP